MLRTTPTRIPEECAEEYTLAKRYLQFQENVSAGMKMFQIWNIANYFKRIM